MFIIVPRSESIRFTKSFRSLSPRFSTPPFQRVGSVSFSTITSPVSCRAGGPGGHARHLPRCDNDPSGEERAARSSSKTIHIASGEVPRLPLHPPARDDNHHLRARVSATHSKRSGSVSFSIITSPVSCRAGGPGGHARHLPQCDNDPSGEERAARASSKTIHIASGEVPRLPFHPPARDDNHHIDDALIACSGDLSVCQDSCSRACPMTSNLADTRLAPPTRKPSTPCTAARSDAFSGETLPP